MSKSKEKTPARKIADFNASPADAEYIRDLANRVVQTAQELGTHYDVRVVERDLLVCHLNIQRLDLNGLVIRASVNDLLHDVLGIHQNIDRVELVLRNGFEPRWKDVE